ncbi:DUF3943 domain-containing protein [Coprobacter secundus]|uniref:DUF3943 domain-containing protein n=1 Tax=Coprobacter secundus subsp. similis TaxID=2751153 RepID=A0A7G1HVC8_9BACT|nr:DUF3943 domain-containing protein [Coprobacter secundus]BCI62742.1 hypothetical protein Cop2CBH44_10950 [Coprobacter secundus subsp. similis]
MKKLKVCLLLLAITIISVAQTSTIETLADTFERDTLNYSLRFAGRHLVGTPVLSDSADVAHLSHKAFWRATAETVGMNIGLWAFDRYALKGHYAYISWNSIKENFRHGFEWDNDHLATNMFGHPYHGSIYFNAGRSNGFNFWQSELFAIGGSAMWEMFMECEYPSTNDIIATPVGGAALGEIFYRMSDLIINDRSSGGERFGRELATFLVDPMRGFTRIVTGRAWERRSTSGRRFGIPPISIDLSLGGRYITLWDNDEGSRAGVTAKIKVEYGDRYVENARVPYDYFSFLLELQGMRTQPLLSRVEIMGRLLSKELVNWKNLNVNIGLYQHFDFFDSDTIRPERYISHLFPCAVPYKLGSPATVGGGVMARFKPSPTVAFDGYLHLNGIILGGMLTDFYRDYNRNYNWGSGFSIKAALGWQLTNDRVSVCLANQFYRLYTWKGYDQNVDWSLTPEGAPVDVQGDKANSSFNHFEVAVNCRLWRNLYLTTGFDMYIRHSNYDDLTVDNTVGPRIVSKQLGTSLMLTYKL